MKNIHAFNPISFYKLFYGLLFGNIIDPNMSIQYADHRVDMFYFAFQKYLTKFKEDILNTDLQKLLTTYREDWFEFWENPEIFFEESDNLYGTFILYERVHGIGHWFEEFDKKGQQFINENFYVIEESIKSFIGNLKHAPYYELMPISFKPEKNMTFLFPYLKKQWIDFVKK